MMEILVVLLLGVVAVQQLKIQMLKDRVEVMKDSAHTQGLAYKAYQELLAHKAIELNRELEDYKEAYEKCYEEYKSLFRERVELKKRLNDIENLHSHMVNTLHVLLKEGRIIKSRYLHSYVPYGNFGQLSNEDRLELFGA